MSWLQLTGVTRRFGKAEVLSGIDLSLGDDEMLVVLGPTGAGKTTLLRIVAGLDAPDAGQVEMDGEEVTHWPPADRDIAFVFQHFALYPDWRGRGHLGISLKAPRRPRAGGED
ncbi:MAG: ATP-binding cassette domain-containing protein [Gemmatimonadetes bacterium]|nr:ATP-binding cassette domain-containing protein [Gemmatimonadota bacterium]